MQREIEVMSSLCSWVWVDWSVYPAFIEARCSRVINRYSSKNSSADLTRICVNLCACTWGCVHACSGNSGVVGQRGSVVQLHWMFIFPKQWSPVSASRNPLSVSSFHSLTFMIVIIMKMKTSIIILSVISNHYASSWSLVIKPTEKNTQTHTFSMQINSLKV